MAMARVTRTIGSSLALSLMAAGLSPGSAFSAATLATWGWVVARHPTTATYTPSARDRGNSAGLTNDVTRADAGRYVVTFHGIAHPNNGGTAIVTAINSQPRFCTHGDIVLSTSPNEVAVTVRCYGFDGETADSQFSIAYQSAGGLTGTEAYLYSDQPTATNYT